MISMQSLVAALTMAVASALAGDQVVLLDASPQLSRARGTSIGSRAEGTDKFSDGADKFSVDLARVRERRDGLHVVGFYFAGELEEPAASVPTELRDAGLAQPATRPDICRLVAVMSPSPRLSHGDICRIANRLGAASRAAEGRALVPPADPALPTGVLVLDCRIAIREHDSRAWTFDVVGTEPRDAALAAGVRDREFRQAQLRLSQRRLESAETTHEAEDQAPPSAAREPSSMAGVFTLQSAEPAPSDVVAMLTMVEDGAAYLYFDLVADGGGDGNKSGVAEGKVSAPAAITPELETQLRDAKLVFKRLTLEFAAVPRSSQ